MQHVTPVFIPRGVRVPVSCAVVSTGPAVELGPGCRLPLDPTGGVRAPACSQVHLGIGWAA